MNSYAQEARAKLARLLGAATVVVASGGEWANAKTGELKPRLHTHYRLQIPARGKDQLAKLKRARKLATAIVGGDTSNVTAVHPIRWPGSWHRKSKPKLARIVSINPKAEIDLETALQILTQAAPAVECAEPTPNRDKQADPDRVFAAMQVVPNAGAQDGDEGEWDEWNTTGMAIFAATGGDPRGFETFDAWSLKSPKYNAENTKARWQHYFRHPPNRIGAGSIFMWANQADPEWQQRYERELWKSITERLMKTRA